MQSHPFSEVCWRQQQSVMNSGLAMTYMGWLPVLKTPEVDLLYGLMQEQFGKQIKSFRWNKSQSIQVCMLCRFFFFSELKINRMGPIWLQTMLWMFFLQQTILPFIVLPWLCKSFKGNEWARTFAIGFVNPTISKAKTFSLGSVLWASQFFLYITTIGSFLLEGSNFNKTKLQKKRGEIITHTLAKFVGKYTEHWTLADFSLT